MILLSVSTIQFQLQNILKSINRKRKIIMKTKSIYIAKIFLFWIPIFCLGILVGCKEKEVIEPIDYSPVQLETTTFSNLAGKTVTLNGSISRLNGIPVEDYGFIIQKIKENEKEIVVSIGSKVSVGEVTLQYQHNSNFELGDRYRYTLYVKTKNGFYRGESNIFEVDGIKIDLLEEKMVPNNNKITVTGDFQFLSENIKMYYRPQYQQEIQMPFQVSSDRKSLTFTFPKSDKFYHGNHVSIFLQIKDKSGYQNTREVANIQILGMLNPPAQTKTYLNEPLELSGIALNRDAMPLSAPFYILINGKRIEYRPQIFLHEIEGLKGSKFQLGYHNGKDSVVFKDSIELIKPIGSSIRFERKVIHSPSIMNINGMDLYTYIMDPEQPKYYLGKHAVPHYFNSSYDTQSFTVRNVPDGVYNFSYSSPFYSVTSTEQVEVRNLKWNTPANTTRYVGEPFTITGNFIDGHGYSIIGNGIGEGAIAQNGQISFIIPGYVIGETEIQIGYGININYNESYYAPKKQRLYIKDFEVNTISPLKGYPGDIITIKGKGLSYIQTTLGGAYVNSSYRSTDEIRFIVPAFAPKGKSAIEMKLNGTTVKYKDLFEVL